MALGGLAKERRDESESERSNSSERVRSTLNEWIKKRE